MKFIKIVSDSVKLSVTNESGKPFVREVERLPDGFYRTHFRETWFTSQNYQKQPNDVYVKPVEFNDAWASMVLEARKESKTMKYPARKEKRKELLKTAHNRTQKDFVCWALRLS